MSQKYEKLKTLLQELFQLDQPDLDFGIYRVLHAKSGEVTQFLEKDLLPQVESAFAFYKSADKSELTKQLAEMRTAIETAGMNPDDSPKVKELEAKIAKESVDIAKLESETYDHLYSFFRRYYSEGDFLSKRVYKAGVYAIPYEGEEVKLHWANADQYYIKTSEYLRDFAFRLNSFADDENGQDPMRVHFRLADVAEGEHGNIKESDANKRVFILASGEDWISEENGELVLRFEYRPATLTDWPDDVRTKPPAQKDLLEIAEERIKMVETAALLTWVSELQKPHIKADGTESDKSKIQVNLERYTARNTFDYFIHKDLGGFLRRELDFYIKNEVMHLDDIESDTVPRVEQYLSKIKVIRSIAHKIIDFLAQLEDFQKKLWLKKKFVVETSYLIRVGIIPEEFYPEIAANDDQRQEWIDLLAIDEIKGDLNTPEYSEPLTNEFLGANASLLIDTKNFDSPFVNKLLSEIVDLDGLTDGFAIHSENFQALTLATEKFKSKLDCIYIDPPYNATGSEIIYKNEYKDSSWLTLMLNRIEVANRLMASHASCAIAIDDYEVIHLSELVDSVFTDFDRNMVVVNHHPQGGMSHNVTRTHEYMLMMTPKGLDVLRGRKKSGEPEYRGFSRSGPGENKSRRGRPNSFYAVLIDEQINRIVGFEPPPARDAAYPVENTVEGYKRKYPINPAGEEKVWCRSYESAITAFERGEIVLSNNGSIQLVVDTADKRHSLMSNWTDAKYNAGPHGTGLVANIIGSRDAFSYPKSIHTVRDAVEAMTWPHENSMVLDFFGGSATTGHAVINLNREDGLRRKFIVVEVGDYFQTVVVPRLKKITFAPEWEGGKPKTYSSEQDVVRSPRIMKVIRLESYEDALNNLELERSEAQESLLDLAESKEADGFREQYMLRYMLDVESRGSQSLLNVEAFTDPTAYKLKVKRPGSDESREVNVDLIETFNWLIGLTVHGIAAPRTFAADFERDSEGRLQLKGRLKTIDSEAVSPSPGLPVAASSFWFRTVTGTVPDGRKTLVIWRKLTGDPEQDNLVLDEWFTRQGYSSKDSEYDLIYVNGDNNLENLRTPDDTWKVRLIEEDFHRLMFDTEDL
jgi:adenine-specific DNA-methyltransferase